MWHVLSLGGGVNSTALLLLLDKERYPLDEVVFADTGAENPETYSYIDTFIKPYLQERHIPLATVRAKETLIERCYRSRAIPDKHYRWSTRDYKIRPINKHLRAYKPITLYMGIAADEAKRVKPDREKWITRVYPLIDHKMGRDECMRYISANNWMVPPKSGCYFCPFQRLSQWHNLLDNHPDLYQKAIEIEKQGSKYPQFSLREGTTLEALRRRFEREDLAEKEQSNLDAYQEECEGFCFT